MKIMIVVGARPNFMKAAPVIIAMRRHNREITERGAARFEYTLVHTGQHYDEAMSGSFFSELGLPQPDIHLAVGSASHAVQTAEIMQRFEPVLLRESPDVVVVVGDVNSTVACALVAAKASFDSGKRPLIAHVEAGLRSFDRDMPEEINRLLTDHLSDLLFVTEESGLRNLRAEGIAEQKIHFVGNTMIDSLLASKAKAEASAVLSKLSLRTNGPDSHNRIHRYAVLTLHRPANVDNRATFLEILGGLKKLGAQVPILFPSHPRTRKRVSEFGLESYFQFPQTADLQNLDCRSNGIYLLEPLGYLDFLCLMTRAMLVVTDSGGIQEETTCLGIPCVTVRENTERPVTVDSGTNVIAGTDSENICAAVEQQMIRPRSGRVPEKWDGHAADRIINVLAQELSHRNPVLDTTRNSSVVASTLS